MGLATEERPIVYRGKFDIDKAGGPILLWGLDEKDKGLNTLGKVLMEVRQVLRAGQPLEIEQMWSILLKLHREQYDAVISGCDQNRIFPAKSKTCSKRPRQSKSFRKCWRSCPRRTSSLLHTPK